MIDQTEKRVTFSQATRYVPGEPHVSQIYRWALRGLRGVKLEWIQVGGKRFTSVEAIERFIAGLTRAAGGEVATPQPRRQRQIEQEGRALAAAGFKV